MNIVYFCMLLTGTVCGAATSGWRREHPFLEAADASPRGPADHCDEGRRDVDEERAWIWSGAHRIPTDKIDFFHWLG